MTGTLLYAGAGLVVGTMVGLTGVGGGSMMTPILMLLFGQSPSVAVGTDLLFSATTKLVAPPPSDLVGAWTGRSSDDCCSEVSRDRRQWSSVSGLRATRRVPPMRSLRAASR